MEDALFVSKANQQDSAHQKTVSTYERWSWTRCRFRINSLKYRLGYDDRIWILGFNILDNGCIVDPFHRCQVFDPTDPSLPWPVSYHSKAIAEMYCLLYTYSMACEIPLTGNQISARSIDSLQRFTLHHTEIHDLLHYRKHDISELRQISPLIVERLRFGDFSLKLQPLPRIPATIILWDGDDEIAEGGTILFDTTISHYLPNLAVELAGLVVWRLRNILDDTVNWGYSTHRALGN